MDGIIFDVDGTIWDSTDVVADSWTECLRSNGVDMLITASRLKSLFGQLLSEIARQILPDETPERRTMLINACEEAEHRALEIHGAPVYPDLEQTLRELSARYPLFIVSNCEAGYIELVLRKTGFGPYITDHLCPGDTGEAKAENIQTIVRKHGLSSPVYVGDTLGDFNACQKAGVPFVFASYGFGQVEHPDYVIEKPLDLLTLF